MPSKPLKSFKSLGVLATLVIIVIGASLIYILSNNDKSLSLEIKAPKDVSIGVPFDFVVGFSNQAKNVMKNVKLTTTLPDGMAFVGSKDNKLIENKDLGNVGEGSLISEPYRLVVLGGENSVKKVKVSISYSPSSLAAQFEKTKEVDIFAKEAGILVDAVLPEKVFGGEQFDIEVNYKNVSDVNFSDLELKIDYPANFSFVKSTLKPDQGNNIWRLGDLFKGSEGSFSITGSLIGPENSSVAFKTELKTILDGQNYSFATKEFPVIISPSALSLSISVNEKEDYISKLGDEITYSLSYVNNTDTTLREVVIRAQLIGEMFDMNFLETKAFLRVSDNTLIWNSNNTPELSRLSPNSAGIIKFKIFTKEEYPIRRWGDKNFILKVKAQVESPTIPQGVKADKTFSIANLETKVSGIIEAEPRVYFRDASSKILNKGELPLRVGKTTNFTIHWLLKNYAVDVSSVEVRAPLASGIKFTGAAKSDFGSVPIYDEKNKEIVWTINSVPANKGVIDDPAEAIFQVEVTPSNSQIGKYIPLLGETSVKALDTFTNVELSGVMAPVDSSLPDDLSAGVQGGVVQP